MSGSYRKEKVPVITVGRYAGTPIDKLPNSYLRWMLGQDFPKDWLECARRKLEGSDYNDLFLSVSRHALDMFSKRFLGVWLESEEKKGEDAVGLASFITNLAQRAWEGGIDTSLHRHATDGIRRDFEGIRWVFGVNPSFPDYKDLITVMEIK